MVNAANYADANKNLRQVRKLYKNVIDAKKSSNNEVFNKEFEKIDRLYANWMKDIENNNFQAAADTFREFMDAFGKVFITSLM